MPFFATLFSKNYIYLKTIFIGWFQFFLTRFVVGKSQDFLWRHSAIGLLHFSLFITTQPDTALALSRKGMVFFDPKCSLYVPLSIFTNFLNKFFTLPPPSPSGVLAFFYSKFDSVTSTPPPIPNFFLAWLFLTNYFRSFSFLLASNLRASIINIPY